MQDKYKKCIGRVALGFGVALGIFMYYKASKKKQNGSLKTIAFIRHGLAEHNVLFKSGKSKEGYKILDPRLVRAGVQQAQEAANHPLLEQFIEEGTLVVVSPLSRTVLTAWTILEQHCEKINCTFILHPDLQETNHHPCDCGYPKSEQLQRIRKMCPAMKFDATEMDEDWNVKRGINSEDKLSYRFERFRKWLAERPEQKVIVVAHHNVFLHMLRISFYNCEVRTYTFDGELYTPVSPKPTTCDEEFTHIDLEMMQKEKWKLKKLKRWGIDTTGVRIR